MARQKLEKILESLRDLPPQEVQSLMRRLFKEGLYRPPTLDDITRKAEQIVKENKLPPDVIDKAIKWAKSQKR
jgi:hypothetical protein